MCANLVVITPGSRAEDLDSSRKTLDEIQQRISRAAKDLEGKKASEQAMIDDLRTVERESERIRDRIRTLSAQLKQLEADIATQKAESEQLQKQISMMEGMVRKRLAALYKSGDNTMLRVLFGTSSPTRMTEDFDFFSRVVRHDHELIETYRHRLAELEAVRQELSALEQKQQALLVESRKDQDRLRQAVVLKEKLIAQVRKDQTVLTRELTSLRERAASLSALVKKLETEKSKEYSEKSGVFRSQKGSLPWPVAGKLKVGFGRRLHPELGTYYDSQGIEIAATPGQTIFAVWPGRVIFANWFKGYGNLLILDHGDGYYTLYAQAARLDKKVGDLLQQGETVGFSGHEGSDHVYFEIRHRGTPLDPTAWLKHR